MTAPDAVRSSVESALRAAPSGTRAHTERIVAVTPVGGGCINHGARIETDAGSSFFLKWNDAAPAGMFEREAEALAVLARTGTLRIPETIAWGGGDGEPGWLLLEYIEPAPPGASADRRLGEGLATLHELASGARFGWEHDNWIGSLPQVNLESESWGDFWRDHRLAPQLALARDRGHVQDALFDRVLELTPEALRDVTEPDMLHGDLWSGNVFSTEGGEPVVIDPALYAGHGEVDLAMSELFGGFGPGFYEGYATVRDIPPEYEAFRRSLYQLYYLLVHVNLFGASYAAGSSRAAERVVAELA